MTFPEFDPVLVQLGPFAIRWYALAYVAGILLGWRYALQLIRNDWVWGGGKPPVTAQQIDDLVLWLTLGIIGGGRLGYVLFYQPAMIWETPLEIFALWNGGMSFHGGFLGVVLAIVVYARRNAIDMLALGDLVAPAVPIGLFFGRIANFINGELWGRPTDAPWGVVFCNDRIAAAYGGCPAGLEPRHPSQLYEAALEGIALFALLRWATHVERLFPRRGVVTGLFMLGYGISRALLETVREPDSFMPDFPLGLTMGMVLSIPMILAGGWLLWRAREPERPRAA